MKNSPRAFLSLVLTLFVLTATSAMAEGTIYDTKADGEELIAKALEKAKAEDKLVAIVWGANWCGWCHRLDDVCRGDAKIKDLLAKDYVSVHIDLGERNKHMDLARKYGLEFNELKIPHMSIHNQEGKRIGQRLAKELFVSDERTGKYSPKPVVEFLEEHGKDDRKAGRGSKDRAAQ